MKVADYIAKFLDNKNVSHVFSITGGASAELNDSILRKDSLVLQYAHNERSCSFMAEGYSRISGKPGVCLVTLGPGATNLITGVTSCWMDSIPQFVISGQSFLTQTIRKSGLRQLGTQEADIIPIVSSITKFAVTITSEKDVIDVLEKAWSVMLDGRPGPVWIEIPSDIQRSEIQVEQRVLRKEIYRGGNKKDPRRADFIEKVVKSLGEAKKPLIHFGNGVRISGAQQEMLRLISITNSPFCLTHNSYDLIQTSHPLHQGLPGIFGHRFSNFALQNADFYLGIGTRLTLAQTGYRKKDFARNAKTFLVDIDKTELEKEHIRVDFGLVSDAKLFMIDLLEALEHISFDFSRWVEVCSDWKQRYSIKNEHANFKINGVSPYDLISEISQNLNSNSTVITDMGTSYQTTYQGISLPEGARLQTNTGFASMGWGLPAALGATYAVTNRSVICLTGDGGLMMSVQELAFAAHCKSDFKIFIYNNRGYLTLRQTQIASFGDRVTGVDEPTGLYFPNYKELAESFGIYYILINTSINLKKQVEDLFRVKGPVIIDVIMDIEQPQAPKAANRIDETGKPVQSSLEDLWPFLDVDVLEHEMRYANEKIE